MAKLLPILTTDDFTGVWDLSLDTYQTSDLSDYITLYEELWVRKILTDELFEEVKTDDPPKQKYQDLRDGGFYTNEDGDRVYFKGLKEFLKNMIYYHWLADNFINTTTGNVVNFNENSNRLSQGENQQYINRKYNQAGIIYDNDIFPFMLNYKDSSGTISSSSETAGTYTLTVPDTKYLANGDTVKIGGVKYTVSNVVSNTSFKITTDTGKDFTGKEYIWQPFKDIAAVSIGAVWL